MDNISLIIQIFNPAFVYKIVAILASGAYVVFAFIMLRRVKTMNRVITHDVFSHVLFLISGIHFLLAISLFLVAIAIL